MKRQPEDAKLNLVNVVWLSDEFHALLDSLEDERAISPDDTEDIQRIRERAAELFSEIKRVVPSV